MAVIVGFVECDPDHAYNLDITKPAAGARCTFDI